MNLIYVPLDVVTDANHTFMCDCIHVGIINNPHYEIKQTVSDVKHIVQYSVIILSHFCYHYTGTGIHKISTFTVFI